jgi:hypothetical protein
LPSVIRLIVILISVVLLSVVVPNEACTKCQVTFSRTVLEEEWEALHKGYVTASRSVCPQFKFLFEIGCFMQSVDH